MCQILCICELSNPRYVNLIAVQQVIRTPCSLSRNSYINLIHAVNLICARYVVVYSLFEIFPTLSCVYITSSYNNCRKNGR